jgi:hypothetical protein
MSLFLLLREMRLEIQADWIHTLGKKVGDFSGDSLVLHLDRGGGEESEENEERRGAMRKR